MKKLYRYSESFGRMGSLDGTFVAEEDQMAKLMGRTVYLGEVLGKHSEITTTLSKKNLKVLTEDQDFITKAEEYGLVPTGVTFEEELEAAEEGNEP